MAVLTRSEERLRPGGHLRVLAHYRTPYQALGKWAVADDSGQGSKEIHAVCAAPGAVDAHRKTGHFPNAAVLMKEFFATSTNEATTGTVSHADKLKGWFVTVRETAGDRTRQPVWGDDGWGWSWFNADKPLKTTSTEYHSDCMDATCPPRPPAGSTSTDIPSWSLGGRTRSALLLPRVALGQWRVRQAGAAGRKIEGFLVTIRFSSRPFGSGQRSDYKLAHGDRRVLLGL